MADRWITRALAVLLAVVVVAVCLPVSAGLVLDPPGGSGSKSVKPIPSANLYRCGYPGGKAPGPWNKSQAASCSGFFGAEVTNGIFKTRVVEDASCRNRVSFELNGVSVTRRTSNVSKVGGLPAGYCGRDSEEELALLFDTKVGQSCPDSSTPDNPDDVAACTCNAGYVADANGYTCVPDCKAGNQVSAGYYDIGTKPGALPKTVACAGTCQVFFDGVAPAGSAMVNGEKHWFAKGSYATTGQACSSSQQQDQQSQISPAVSDPTKQDKPCKDGQGVIQMNGQTRCVDQSTGQVTDESKTMATVEVEKKKVTNPDGSVTETEVRTRVDAQGNKEVTTTTTTTHPDGSQTTSKTVENPLPGSPLSGDGNGGTDANKSDGTEGEKGECEKNPSASGCGGEAAGVSSLYSAKDNTMSSVLAKHRDTFMSSPMGSAAGSFFVVSGGGGCPSFNRRIPFINADVSIDQFCTPFAAEALAIFKGALLLCCSFFAFRVAVE